MTAPAIHHAAPDHAFEARIDGERAVLDYALDGDVMTIEHTEVPPALGGRGLGGTLVQAAFDEARARGWKVRATCSYASSWIGKHPEVTPLLGCPSAAPADGRRRRSR